MLSAVLGAYSLLLPTQTRTSSLRMAATTQYKEQRGSLAEVDADAMLSSQSFPISADDLVAKAKDFIASDYGAEDTAMLAADFQFVGPIVGPLSRQEYLDALGGNLNPSVGFPDLVGRQFGFHADPIEPGRVWWVSRPTGSFTQPFFGADPEEGPPRIIETPPQAMGVVFNTEGRVSKINVGVVMDRTSGNTGGLGGLFGFLWFVGKSPPVREYQPFNPSWQFALLQKVGPLLAKLQKD